MVSENIHKKCCCEIKQAPDKPESAILSLNKVNLQPNSDSFSISYLDLSSISVLNYSSKLLKSFHSPPERDISIFNSNLRI